MRLTKTHDANSNYQWKNQFSIIHLKLDYNSLQDNSKQFFLNKYLSPSNYLRKQCKSLKSFAMESKYNDVTSVSKIEKHGYKNQ